ncbi:hypothetical protein KSD_50380 [Ktedonobacter sp. SOSP1-85]|uniref:hypothetical protein n=1 Tax=Ktedonobacter sp. SOSP1-85 TaxID=2778367 RepID=UPI00191590D6|nr:hypothetical protein [Ktedonobacter sp. SOSP1-85]GHO77267.1 hypothetical protein KSD_50380 [Ktedonobacter sp. SOSP1-85]
MQGILVLGIILHEMLTGEPLQDMDTASHLLTLSSEVDTVIRKATAQKPSDRYQDVHDFAYALHVAAAQLYNDQTMVTQATLPPATATRSKPWISFSVPGIHSVFSTPLRTLLAIALAGFCLAFCILSAQAFSRPPTILQQQDLTLQSSSASNDLDEAKVVVEQYYQNWEQKNYQEAYALLDPSYQQQYSYQTLLPYYRHTHKSCVNLGQATRISTTQTRVDVTDNAIEDNLADGGTATNRYAGYFIVSQQGNVWKLTPYLHLQSIHGTCY